MAGAETLERIVAVVNGDVILYGDIEEQLKGYQKMAPNVNLQDPEQRKKAEQSILQSLIRQRLAEQEVKRLKVTVAKGEVDSTIKELKRDNGMTDAQFEQALSRDGMTMKQLEEKVRLELERSRLMDRVIKSKIVVNDSQIDARMQTASLPAPPTPVSTQTTGKRHLGMIFLPLAEGSRADQVSQGEKAARKVLAKIKEGNDFAKVAAEYSKGPAAMEGGDIGLVSADELTPEIEKGIHGLSVGDVSDVIKTPKGCYILKILESRPENPSQAQSQPVTVSREMVRKQLFMEELNRKYDEWMQELEKKAFIKITL